MEYVNNMPMIMVYNAQCGEYLAETITVNYNDKTPSEVISISLEGDNYKIKFYENRIVLNDPTNKNIKYRRRFLEYVKVNDIVIWEAGCLEKIANISKKLIDESLRRRL